MADLAQLERALIKADAAGDTAAATAFAGEIRRMRHAQPQHEGMSHLQSGGQGMTAYDPTRDMSGMDKFRAGMGKAFVDVGRGAGQLVGAVDRASVDESRRLDAHLMATGAGMSGNIAGNVAAYAPLALVPGANTIAGGAALGALTGAAQPVGEGDSRLANATIGGMAGALVPTAIRGGKTVKAAVIDPFTDKGAQRIAGGLLNRTAGNPNAAAQRMASVKGVTPGFNPTAAQSADDAGVAALERATRAANPGAFDDVERAQRQALADAVRGVAGDPLQREAAVAAREAAVKPLYDSMQDTMFAGGDDMAKLLNRARAGGALTEAQKIAGISGRKFSIPVVDDAAQAVAGTPNAQITPVRDAFTKSRNEGGKAMSVPVDFKKLEQANRSTYPKIPTGNVFKNPVGELGYEQRFAADKAFKSGSAKSGDVNIADIIPTQKNLTMDNLKGVQGADGLPNLVKVGDKYYVTDGHHRIGLANLRNDATVNANIFDATAQPKTQYELAHEVLPLAKEGLMKSAAPEQALREVVGQAVKGSDLQAVKIGLDQSIGNATGQEKAALLQLKKEYLDWIGSKSPEYLKANNLYADMSKPINQMDVGQAMADRLIPALYRDMPSPSQLNAQAFAKALSDQGDNIARSATGMKGAKLESIMSPEQLQKLRGVASDLQMSKSAELAGRGVGSDTVQKTAMSHIAAQAGIPNWMSNIARVPGGWAKRLGDAVYGSSDDRVKTLMAELLKNPDQAAQAMQAAGVSPSVMAQILKQGTQGLALSATPSMVNQ